MRRSLLFLLLLTIAGCHAAPAVDTSKTLLQARSGHATQLTQRSQAGEPVEQPPPEVFELVKYTSPAGELAAYVSPDPKDDKQHPAIIWITGGDCNTIGDVWSPADRSDDQTAAAYRKAGIVMMFPSLRGGNQNPGVREGFYGEVDDVIAAREYLAAQSYVDPNRIYLGGHSTGGTLVMLVAAASDKFRAVFAFGPVDNVAGYGSQWLPMVDLWNAKEVQLRSPKSWLHSIQSPTFVIEGASQGNASCVSAMQSANKNSLTQFFIVSGKDHFSVLAPTNELLAQKVLADTGEKTNISIGAAELE